MNIHDEEHRILDLATLEQVYGHASGPAIEKEIDYIHPHYRALIAASPFAVLATCGPDGMDASPRGDPAGFITVENENTLLVPDRRGNNRIDSMRNILTNPHVALLFLIPGCGEEARQVVRIVRKIGVHHDERVDSGLRENMGKSGYVANAEQSASSLKAIEFSFVWLPAICLVLSVIPVLFYKRFENLEPQIHAELDQRRIKIQR